MAEIEGLGNLSLKPLLWLPLRLPEFLALRTPACPDAGRHTVENTCCGFGFGRVVVAEKVVSAKFERRDVGYAESSGM